MTTPAPTASGRPAPHSTVKFPQVVLDRWNGQQHVMDEREKRELFLPALLAALLLSNPALLLLTKLCYRAKCEM
eukprot:33739-Amphidinium_carterae.1